MHWDREADGRKKGVWEKNADAVELPRAVRTMSEAGNFVSTRRSEGWQRLAARACDEHAFCFMRSRRTFSTLPCVPCAVALASRALCCPRVHCPATGDEVTFPRARVLLLRPCRLRRADARAMGNATCWVITVPRVLHLGCCRRALPLEHAVARLPRRRRQGRPQCPADMKPRRARR